MGLPGEAETARLKVTLASPARVEWMAYPVTPEAITGVKNTQNT